MMTDEQRKLVEDNHSLIYFVIHNMGLSIEDNYDLAAIGLCKAAMAYRPGENRFSTYACKCIKNEIKHEFQQAFKQKRAGNIELTSYDALIHCDGEDIALVDCIRAKESTENEALSRIMYGEILDAIGKSDGRVIPWFSRGYTQMEIAKILGVTQQNVSRVKKRVENLLCCHY